MRLSLTSPKRGTPWVPKTLFGSGRQAQSPKPPPPPRAWKCCTWLMCNTWRSAAPWTCPVRTPGNTSSHTSSAFLASPPPPPALITEHQPQLSPLDHPSVPTPRQSPLLVALGRRAVSLHCVPAGSSTRHRHATRVWQGSRAFVRNGPVPRVTLQRRNKKNRDALDTQQRLLGICTRRKPLGGGWGSGMY